LRQRPTLRAAPFAMCSGAIEVPSTLSTPRQQYKYGQR
jgi:hypothetical protein